MRSTLLCMVILAVVFQPYHANAQSETGKQIVEKYHEKVLRELRRVSLSQFDGLVYQFEACQKEIRNSPLMSKAHWEEKDGKAHHGYLVMVRTNMKLELELRDGATYVKCQLPRIEGKYETLPEELKRFVQERSGFSDVERDLATFLEKVSRTQKKVGHKPVGATFRVVSVILIDADGKQTSLPYDWLKVSDDEKKHLDWLVEVSHVLCGDPQLLKKVQANVREFHKKKTGEDRNPSPQEVVAWMRRQSATQEQ